VYFYGCEIVYYVLSVYVSWHEFVCVDKGFQFNTEGALFSSPDGDFPIPCDVCV